MGWADDFTAPVKPAEPAPRKSWLSDFIDRNADASEAARQLGLTARHAITGLTGIPAVVGNGLNTAINYGIRGANALTDSHIPELQMPTAMVQRGLTAAGLPEPKNSTERLVGDVASSMAGVTPSYAAGKFLANSAAPITASVGRTLSSVPGNQLVGAGSGGAAAGAAREEGLGDGWQLGAGLAGGLVGGLGAGSAGSAARWAANKVNPSFADAVAPRFSFNSEPAAVANRAGAGVDEILSNSPGTPSDAAVQALKSRAAALQSQNVGSSPQAVARAADFRNLGVQPTLGQITRDPGDWAREWNLRSLHKPMEQRLQTQNQQLATALDGVIGNAGETYPAGQSIEGALKSFDDGMKSQVTAAYQKGRAASDLEWNIPAGGLASDYGNILNDFADKVPAAVRNRFDQYGLSGGTQSKVFNYKQAEDLIQLINSHVGNDPPTNLALGKLRNAVKTAITDPESGDGGPFAEARQLAAQRFSLHDQVPALDAVANGKVAPDDIVRKYIVGGKVQDLQNLAPILMESDPDALVAAQAQLGAPLKQAAFGQNLTGDKTFAPESFARALDRIGTDKLGAFFGPDDIDTLQGIGRVGGYINSPPAASARNFSNSAPTLMDLGRNLPWVGKAVNSLDNRAFIARALAAKLENAPALPDDTAAPYAAPVILNAAKPAPSE